MGGGTAIRIDLDQTHPFFFFKKVMSRPELVAPPEIVGWIHALSVTTADLIPPRAVLWRY